MAAVAALRAVFFAALFRDAAGRPAPPGADEDVLRPVFLAVDERDVPTRWDG
jgi:hypothetical protein